MSIDFSRLAESAQGATLRTVLGLPPRAQRLLAGRPVLRDGQLLDVEAQLLLRLQKLGGRGLDMTPEGRAGTLLETRLAGGDQPIGEVREVKVDGAESPLPARLYVPHALLDSTGPDPLLVYLHGGGWVVGDLDSHDAVCRVLAETAAVRVLSVDYALAPEAPFPAAPLDCAAAYRWVVAHAAELGADPSRLAIGGDSAGGNLAALTALTAAREGLPLAFQLLIYPATDHNHTTESHRLFSEGFLLETAGMVKARQQYLGDHDRSDPAASPSYADIPAGLAPAYVATAGFDPLRDEGEAYARKLADAGVPVELERFPGQIHGFFNLVGAGRTARAAVDGIAGKLAAAL